MGTGVVVQAALWMTAAAAFGASRENVTVRVLDNAGIPQEVLRDAAREAREMYLAAGIEIEWMACRVRPQQLEACPQPAGTELQVKIVPEGPPALDASRRAYAQALLSKNDESGFLAYVFFRRVEEGARRSECTATTLLAAVMAHEVAHLLGLKHSTGLMKAEFDRRDMHLAAMGSLRFTEEGARRLRSAVALTRQ